MPDVRSLKPSDPSRLGDFPLVGRLGEGGQGIVYLGHGANGEQVAIKLLRAQLDRDSKAHARFAREVAIAERVAPVCTARVIDHMISGGATSTTSTTARRPLGAPPEPSAPTAPAAPPAPTSAPPSQVATARLPPTPGPLPGPAPTTPAMPPPPARPPVGWELIGPGLGSLVGLYLFTLTLRPEWTDHTRTDLHPTAPLILLMPFAHLVAAAFTAPVGAVLGRRYPNRIAAISTGLILVGSTLDMLAANHTQLVAGRIVSGLGTGALVAEAVVLALRAGHRRAYTVGLAVGLGTLAVVLGPILGGVLATILGVRWAFLITLPPLILALLVSIVSGIIKATSRPAHH